jgi:ATP-dependent DNA helicase PIF1
VRRPLHHRSPRNVGMHFLDTLTLVVSFLIALLVCCMLLALTRLGVSLKSVHPKGSPPQTHLPRTRFSTSRPKRLEQLEAPLPPSPRPYYGYLTNRPHTPATMFKQALNSHNAAIPPPVPSVASKQQSLGTSFGRNGSTQNMSPRPLASTTKQNGAGKAGLGTFALGTKRTSNGLAKSLSSQEDPFSYPTLNVANSEKENHVSATRTAPQRSANAGLATALFDEDDFDSDVDLEMEDPATKGTVKYPTLPQVASSESRDSGYQSRPDTARQTLEPDSSQQIPWSSSPIEHFKAPQRPEVAPPKSRRRMLPWSQQQRAASSQQMEDRIDSEEDEVARPTKRQTFDVRQFEMKQEPAATPKTKNPYQWNTTASALKQQQKNLREANKKKENDVSVDDLQDAAKKRKKTNTVHKIFLSEEQTNVLSLVTEHKKSVFFTGSAGMSSTLNYVFLLIFHPRYW